MIWKRWTREHLAQWIQRSKWSKEHVQNLKEGELVCLLDYSVTSCQYKWGRIIEIFTGNDDVVCLISKGQNGTWRAEPASGEVSASILRWCFRDQKERRRCCHHFKSSTKAIREHEIN